MGLPSVSDEWESQVSEVGHMVKRVDVKTTSAEAVSAVVVLLEGTEVSVRMEVGRGFLATWDTPAGAKDGIFDSLHSLLLNVSPQSSAVFSNDLNAKLAQLAEQ